MFTNDIVAAQKAVTLSDTHPALPETVALRLRSENGATDRGNSLLGNFTIAHSPTKELKGGYRHVARLNYAEQGDIPGASVHSVITNNASLLGEQRAGQAFSAHLAALCQLDGTFFVDDSCVDADGFVTVFKTPGGADPETWNTALAHLFSVIIPRLLSRES